MIRMKRPWLIQIYDVVGDYIFRGQRGTQVGEFHFYEQGILFGKLADANDGVRIGLPNLVLGTHILEDGGLVIGKFASRSSRNLPVYWSFSPEIPGRHLNPAKYTGLFAFGSSVSQDNFDRGLLLEKGVPDFDELISSLNLDAIRSFGDSGYIESIESNGRRNNQTGNITLTVRPK